MNDRATVYIVRCSDGSYDVGITRIALETRVSQHNLGTFDGYTKSRRPVELVWSQAFVQLTDAIAAERQLEGWSRAKKEALIAGRFDLLPGLSRSRIVRGARQCRASLILRQAQDEAPRDRACSLNLVLSHVEGRGRHGGAACRRLAYADIVDTALVAPATAKRALTHCSIAS